MPGMSRSGRGGAGAALAILLLPVLPVAAAHAQDLEEGLFELHVQRIPTRPTILTLVDPAGRVLIPLRPVLEQVGIASRAAGDAIVLEWPPGTWVTTLDLAAGTIRSGTRTDSLPPRLWHRRGGELFLDAEPLAALLRTEVQVRWADLSIAIAASPDFPAIRRLDIEARRGFEQRRDPRLRAARLDAPYPPRTGGLAASWGASFLEAAGTTRGSARAAGGAALLGGSLEAGGTLVFGDDIATAIQDGYVRLARGFPHRRWIRQVQAGSVFTDAPLGRRIAGITVTNAPFTTPRLFGETLISPELPSGWEYEVYQGDYLLGVGDAATGAGVRAPLGYGNTPVRVRMIGPAGQEIIEDLVFFVRPEQVPAGQWRHFAGAGVCIDAGCDRYGYAELRHGVSTRLTLGAGIEALEPDAAATTDWRPFAYVGANPLDRLATELQLQPGRFLRASAQMHTATQAALGAGYAWYRPAGSAVVGEGWNAQLTASAPVPALRGRFVNLRLLLRGADQGRIDFWNVALATNVRRTYTSLEVESGLQRSDVLTLRTYTTVRRAPGAFLRDASVALTGGVSRDGAELLELGAAVRPLGAATLTAGLRLRRSTSPSLTLGFVARFAPGYVQSRTVQSRDGASWFASFDGGLAAGGAGPMLLPFESLGRAGVAGIVFQDHDGDGARGPDEAPVADAIVSVGGHRVRTDRNGRFRVWQLEPYEPITVGVDSLSIDFGWVPATPATPLRPTPNLFARIDLPLVRTRELAGRVLAADDLPFAGGILVEILDADDTIIDTARTFSDGEFYIPRIRPGRYRARIAPSSLDALAAETAPAELAFIVPPDGDAPILLDPFTLVRRSVR
jgi:hypothetical protein